MPYVIRNALGEISGVCTGRPGEGNLRPDGSPEVVEFEENETPEIIAFVSAQEARMQEVKPRIMTLSDKVEAKLGITLAELQAELARL